MEMTNVMEMSREDLLQVVLGYKSKVDKISEEIKKVISDLEKIKVEINAELDSTKKDLARIEQLKARVNQ